tara:strand:- start:23 stop:160 length:138 start_codon:yes stop_codon:yes gene_type:complete
MGRAKKYHSEEEKKIAKKKQWMEYYERNKDKINKKRMDMYYDRKL